MNIALCEVNPTTEAFFVQFYEDLRNIIGSINVTAESNPREIASVDLFPSKPSKI